MFWEHSRQHPGVGNSAPQVRTVVLCVNFLGVVMFWRYACGCYLFVCCSEDGSLRIRAI